MFSLNIEKDVGLVFVQILQFDPVGKLAHDLPVVHLGLFKLKDELLDGSGDLVEEDSSAVDEGVRLGSGEVGPGVVQAEGVVVGGAQRGLQFLVPHLLLAPGRIYNLKSLVQHYLRQQLLVQLVYAVTVVHYLEPAHHEARYVRLVLVPQLLPGRVVLSLHIPVLGLYLPQSLESSLQGLHVVVSFHILPGTGDGNRHILGVGSD